jgi:hypothetical protein
MLLATLAPAISRTLASTRGVGDWVEICSGTSMRWVQLGVDANGGDAGESKGSSLLLNECGHCLLSADRFAPLIPSLPAFSVAASAWPTPQHRGFSAVSFSALSPSARGPPLLF